jgi:hypothetical protein
MKIGVISNVDANHGSCVFNFSLTSMMASAFPKARLKFLNYATPSWYLYEYLRAVKPQPKIPHFNLARFIRLIGSNYRNLDIEDAVPLPFLNNNYDLLVKKLASKNFDVLVVGKVVWDIAKIWQTNKFPNLFWLSEQIPASKIAYAVSGHRTDLRQFEQVKDRVRQILNSYKMIGVRDQITHQMIVEAGLDSEVYVRRVPDPAFFFENRAVDVNALLKRHGLDPQRPIFGLLLYGQPELSLTVREHYRRKGYQIVNFNMLNPYADFNLGHKVNPFEWAALFKSLTCCLTDRFHCSIFCLREGVPFVGIEPFAPPTAANSKVLDLLSHFSLHSFYRNSFDPAFRLDELIDTLEKAETFWQADCLPAIQTQLIEDRKVKEEFFNHMQTIIN